MSQKRPDDKQSSESANYALPSDGPWDRQISYAFLSDGPCSRQITTNEELEVTGTAPPGSGVEDTGTASLGSRWNLHKDEDAGGYQNGIPGIGDKELPMLYDFESEDDALPVGVAQTKEERMTAQVRTFVRKAQNGMRVYLFDMESLLVSQSLFRIDEMTATLTLRTALAPEQEFQLKDLKSVVKGEAFKNRVPRLAHASRECLLLVFGGASEESLQCLFFKDVNDRNEFRTNMNVVRVMATRGTM
jgi:hypothetical protein